MNRTATKFLTSLSKLFMPVTFLLLLFVPIIQMSFNVLPDYKASDNREMAKMPELSIVSLTAVKQFTQDYEIYFNDNFGLRNSLIRINALINFHLLNKSPVPDVVIGKNGWLFYNSAKDGVNLPDFMGSVPFSADDIKSIEIKMKTLQEEFRKRKIVFVVALAPSKHTIYPEMLPDEVLSKKGKLTRADQIDEVLPRIGVRFVDLRNELTREKESNKIPLYYLTDTHWNNLGAFYGYQRLADAIHQELPNFRGLSYDDFDVKVERNPGEGDIANMVSMCGTLTDFIVKFIQKRPAKATAVKSDYGDISIGYEVNDTTLPKLLVFRDSFFSALIPFLTESFSRSVFLSQLFVDLSIVDKEKPNVVVLEFVERYSSVLM